MTDGGVSTVIDKHVAGSHRGLTEPAMQPVADPAGPPLLDDRHLVVSTMDPGRAYPAVSAVYTEADWVFGPSRGPASPIHLCNVSFGAFGLSTMAYGREVAIRPRGAPGALMVIGVVRGGLRFARGARALDAGPGTVVVIPASEEQRMSCSADAQTWKFTFRRERVEAHLARLTEGRTGPLEFELAAGSRAQWLQWLAHARMLATLARQAAGSLRAMSGPLEEMLLVSLLSGHAHTQTDTLRRPPGRIASAHVRRAIDWIAQHLAEPITLETLADAAGCSMRSLHRGFRDALDVAPMSYLREARLRRVRDALQDSSRRSETITQVAMACGFSHLGEFCAHYRRAFGEQPRQTRLGP